MLAGRVVPIVALAPVASIPQRCGFDRTLLYPTGLLVVALTVPYCTPQVSLETDNHSGTRTCIWGEVSHNDDNAGPGSPTVAVVFTRYAAVFPLSEAINFFHRHARGQRQDELPHSYQMMLFWAGLRGAVGIVLAAGFQGENAQMLRTTVLVVIMLTVVVFGGTTARMLEVLGIRTDVEDEAEDDSDDDECGGPWYTGGRRVSVGVGGSSAGRWRWEEEDPRMHVGVHYARGGAGVGMPALRSYNHQAQQMGVGLPDASPVEPVASPFVTDTVFSAASSESWDSDGGEVLPLAAAVRGPGAAMSPGPGEDGKWFQAIDERYLLPLFSNATASWTFHARQARRMAAMGSGSGSGYAEEGLAGKEEGEDGLEMELVLKTASAATTELNDTSILGRR